MSGILGPSGALELGALLRDTLLLLVGWALGILSAPITDTIRRRSAKLRLTRVLVTELRSLQDALAGVVIQVSRRRGALTRALLEALLTTLKSSGQVVAEGRAMRTIQGLLEMGDQALAVGPAPDPAPDRRLLALKTDGLPFLESHVYRLDLYSHETQRLLVEIRAGLENYNECAEEATRYHFMMLGSGAGRESLRTLHGRVEASYDRAAEMASDLVSRIAVLMSLPEMRAA